ncbi:Acetyltransferase [Bibersteinia trehalosi USDA-ARS-USMARC-188]|uniref:Acetyltransferase n=2 Tax=Bibersteinia trehalosi TaxID=47735 RepID=A0A4V7IC07_BIBTR|nr:GNAT family N-acetyltransferase [Bibersteinia trehalosi]AGH37683.1 Acetyltransferase [Bibersteinia trehalosi USDA-ARS-USMARC-192]AHG82508.1 Acetyltransferase [Bibersteinia trehalosi USDA-ARS-USMARC-188]AHG84842.1 Acetyltransferase [Bibersteinia trehalosi USDA-ARS-USMARC-189]
MQWHAKTFAELSSLELFEIYYARTAVFVVEQNCAYQEVDNNDLQAVHFFAKNANNLTAYCRLIPSDDGVHIGRVLVAKENRGSGLARELVQKAMDYCSTHFPNQPIHAQAQSYLQAFYEGFGFKAVSEVYLEDGIPHLDMVKNDV